MSSRAPHPDDAPAQPHPSLADPSRLIVASGVSFGTDKFDQPVVLFPSEWTMRYFLEKALRRDGYEVLAEYCKGCGLCVRECPSGSLKMLEEAK